MLCLHLENTNPFFCLAAEEFLLKNQDECVFLIWQSRNAVIVGKHQNALAEINYRYVRENGIKVCRRISGGGTVFHDEGNVNFTFIRNVSSPSDINFRMFLEPITGFLGTLGVAAEISGRNDLVLDGKKISGNAQHVYKNRVLHHGTLLFDSDLSALGNAIRANPGRYTGKAVQSNRSPVTNIRPFIKGNPDTRQFILHFLNHLVQVNHGTLYEFSREEELQVKLLANEKFSSFDWIFGYSPKYVYVNNIGVNEQPSVIEIQVEKGIITASHCKSGLTTDSLFKELNHRLVGERHIFENLHEVIARIFHKSDQELVYGFF